MSHELGGLFILPVQNDLNIAHILSILTLDKTKKLWQNIDNKYTKPLFRRKS
jgi:hypothetical protein